MDHWSANTKGDHNTNDQRKKGKGTEGDWMKEPLGLNSTHPENGEGDPGDPGTGNMEKKPHCMPLLLSFIYLLLHKGTGRARIVDETGIKHSCFH